MMNKIDEAAFIEWAGEYVESGNGIESSEEVEDAFEGGMLYGRQTAYPPLFRVCANCGGSGTELVARGIPGIRPNDEDVYGSCKAPGCDHGKIWIYYTPQQWLDWYKEHRPDDMPELRPETPVWWWSVQAQGWVKGYWEHAQHCQSGFVALNLSAFGQPAPLDGWRPEGSEG